MFKMQMVLNNILLTSTETFKTTIRRSRKWTVFNTEDLYVEVSIIGEGCKWKKK